MMGFFHRAEDLHESLQVQRLFHSFLVYRNCFDRVRHRWKERYPSNPEEISMLITYTFSKMKLRGSYEREGV